MCGGKEEDGVLGCSGAEKGEKAIGWRVGEFGKTGGEGESV